jgi:hypothetical protein
LFYHQSPVYDLNKKKREKSRKMGNLGSTDSRVSIRQLDSDTIEIIDNEDEICFVTKINGKFGTFCSIAKTILDKKEEITSDLMSRNDIIREMESNETETPSEGEDEDDEEEEGGEGGYGVELDDQISQKKKHDDSTYDHESENMTYGGLENFQSAYMSGVQSRRVQIKRRDLLHSIGIVSTTDEDQNEKKIYTKIYDKNMYTLYNMFNCMNGMDGSILIQLKQLIESNQFRNGSNEGSSFTQKTQEEKEKQELFRLKKSLYCDIYNTMMTNWTLNLELQVLTNTFVEQVELGISNVEKTRLLNHTQEGNPSPYAFSSESIGSIKNLISQINEKKGLIVEAVRPFESLK